MKQQPRLMRSSLTHRVYAVVRYTDLGEGAVQSLEKYDVTEDFYAMTSEITKEIRELCDEAVADPRRLASVVALVDCIREVINEP